MSGISTYGAGVFAGVLAGVYGMPDILYVGVTTEDPYPNSTGRDTNEPDDASYVRQPINMSATDWSAPTGGIVTNLVDIEFPAATQDWEVVKTWVLYTAETEGQVMFWSNFEQAIKVLETSVLTVPIGAMSIGVIVPEDMR